MTDPSQPESPARLAAMLATDSADGVIVAVRVTPRAGRDAVAGVARLADGRVALAVRIAAPPVDGAANAALVACLAAALGLRARDVAVIAGETGRLKRVALHGEAAALRARIAALIA